MLLSRKTNELINNFLDNNYCSYNFRLWEYATANEFMNNNCHHISLSKKEKDISLLNDEDWTFLGSEMQWNEGVKQYIMFK